MNGVILTSGIYFAIVASGGALIYQSMGFAMGWVLECLEGIGLILHVYVFLCFNDIRFSCSIRLYQFFTTYEIRMSISIFLSRNISKESHLSSFSPTIFNHNRKCASRSTPLAP
jgi:hypothetical protein